MAKLSRKTIESLRRILHEEHGGSLTFAEAAEIAHGLVGYFDTLQKIASKDKKTYETTK